MMTDNTERAQVGWGFWLWWVLASTVGMAVGIAVLEAVGLAGGSHFSSGAVVGAITGGVMVWLLRQPVTRELSLPQDTA